MEALRTKAIELSATIPKKYKTMDSLQLAVAVLHDCDLFLTNDKQLKHSAAEVKLYGNDA